MLGMAEEKGRKHWDFIEPWIHSHCNDLSSGLLYMRKQRLII